MIQFKWTGLYWIGTMQLNTSELDYTELVQFKFWIAWIGLSLHNIDWKAHHFGKMMQKNIVIPVSMYFLILISWEHHKFDLLHEIGIVWKTGIVGTTSIMGISQNISHNLIHRKQIEFKVPIWLNLFKFSFLQTLKLKSKLFCFNVENLKELIFY